MTIDLSKLSPDLWILSESPTVLTELGPSGFQRLPAALNTIHRTGILLALPKRSALYLDLTEGFLKLRIRSRHVLLKDDDIPTGPMNGPDGFPTSTFDPDQIIPVLVSDPNLLANERPVLGRGEEAELIDPNVHVGYYTGPRPNFSRFLPDEIGPTLASPQRSFPTWWGAVVETPLMWSPEF